jgi:hypothetical protein
MCSKNILPAAQLAIVSAAAEARASNFREHAQREIDFGSCSKNVLRALAAEVVSGAAAARAPMFRKRSEREILLLALRAAGTWSNLFS